MKKKWIIIIPIIILILGIIFLKKSDNLMFYIRMLGVNKDIVIEECERNPGFGGYATIHDYYYIDLKKKKIYHVEDYYVFGFTTNSIKEKGSHYTLKGTKKLTDDELTEIKRLTQLKSDYDPNSNTEVPEWPWRPEYSYYDNFYIITYNKKTIELTYKTAEKLVDIIKEME